MYSHIRGTLVFSSVTYVVIEASGIGYKIAIPARLFRDLPPVGNPLFLHLSFVIREFSQMLVGFLSASERDAFEVLLGATGVGPKTALNILSHLSLQELQAAIHHEEVAILSKVPGIGKKTAERLILEMRDKLSAFLPEGFDHLSLREKSPLDFRHQTIQDAMNALIHLGYHQSIAQKAIKKALPPQDDTVDLALLITDALKHV